MQTDWGVDQSTFRLKCSRVCTVVINETSGGTTRSTSMTLNMWGARTNTSFKAEGFGSHMNDLRRLVLVNRLQNDFIVVFETTEIVLV